MNIYYSKLYFAAFKLAVIIGRVCDICPDGNLPGSALL